MNAAESNKEQIINGGLILDMKGKKDDGRRRASETDCNRIQDRKSPDEQSGQSNFQQMRSTNAYGTKKPMQQRIPLWFTSVVSARK